MPEFPPGVQDRWPWQHKQQQWCWHRQIHWKSQVCKNVETGGFCSRECNFPEKEFVVQDCYPAPWKKNWNENCLTLLNENHFPTNLPSSTWYIKRMFCIFIFSNCLQCDSQFVCFELTFQVWKCIHGLTLWYWEKKQIYIPILEWPWEWIEIIRTWKLVEKNHCLQERARVHLVAASVLCVLCQPYQISTDRGKLLQTKQNRSGCKLASQLGTQNVSTV